MMEHTDNTPDADPRTTILSQVCPTPGTKKAGTIPVRHIRVNRPEKPKTPA